MKINSMAKRIISRKILSLIALMATSWVASFCSSWQLSLTYTNTGTGGAMINSTAYLGEDPNATNGWDWNFDVPLPPAPNNPGYVRIYFPHSDFGANNGNYLVDIRANNPVQKTWNISLAVNTPLSTAYSLSWVIPPLMPDYYQPKLLIGSSTINMRSQSSYAWTGYMSSCSVRLDLLAGMPYLLAIPPDLLFSNNQPQYLNLQNYFSVISGNLSFAFSANANLEQSLVSVNDSLHWKVNPLHGYSGTTSVNLSATGSGGTKTVSVDVTRDATNSPPVFSPPLEAVQIEEGSGGYFSYEGLISDPDLDPVQIQAIGDSTLSLEVMQSLQAVHILPSPGVKGNGSFILELSDGLNPAQSYNIPIYIYPLEPQQVTNVNINIQNGSLLIAWSPVTHSIWSIPVFDLEYRVCGFSDAACTQPLFNLVTPENNLSLPAIYPTVFVRITTINE